MSEKKELLEESNEHSGTVISEEEAIKLYQFKELTDEELNNVTGGDLDRGKFVFTGHVGQYDGVVGEYYYVVYDHTNPCEFEYGELLRTWEDLGPLGGTVRRHEIRVVLRYQHNQYEQVNYIKYREGKNYSLYTRALRKDY